MTAMIESRRLGASGFKVPALTLGTGTFGGTNDFFKAWGNTDAEGARRLVDICLEHGLTLFDSADIYSDGDAERILGEAIKGKRDRVLLASKVRMVVGDGPNDGGLSRHHIIESCEASLRRLGTDHLDLYRLESEDDLESTGFWDLFSEEKGLILIEWAERLNPAYLPTNWFRLRIKYDRGPGVTERKLTVEEF